MKVLYNDDFIEKRVLMWKVETEAINLKKHREKFLPLQNKEETKEIKVSTTESEIGYYVKGEREKSFAYSFYTLVIQKDLGGVYGLNTSLLEVFFCIKKQVRLA